MALAALTPPSGGIWDQSKLQQTTRNVGSQVSGGPAQNCNSNWNNPCTGELSAGGAGVNVILVSNRVASPKADGPIEGGLASALLQAVRNSGAIWVGARVGQSDISRKEPLASLETLGTGATARVDVPAERYRQYYEGFANSALWPVLHSRPDLIRVNQDDYRAYCEVNTIMARALRGFLQPDGMIWVHDYHFLTLARELRRLGVDRPIGFFLHTPFPRPSNFASLPAHREIVRAMLQYDLLGFQTETDLANFASYVERTLRMSVLDGNFVGETRTTLASFPIGIDARAFASAAVKAAAKPDIARLRASLNGAKLIIGVDRIDYSKGLENRLHAIDQLFNGNPDLKRQISMLQVALPSRGQISAYGRLQTELATLVTEINGRHGEVDWMPIRYLNKGFDQATLAGFYRTAQVGLVTPLYDGMNLVAKEYVAAQNPLDPGVLVLSERAGAAQQLDAAILVNPHDTEGIAEAIQLASTMPQEERRERWETMMESLERDNIHAWFRDFMAALGSTTRALPKRRSPDLAMPLVSPVPPPVLHQSGLAAIKTS
jgi:trehalose 6-phosphate synthase